MEPYQRLEAQWAEFNGLDPTGMVCCSSGTAALHLALESLQLPPASRVICPDFTMIACARAITLAGLEPVFMDCDERLLMDPTLLRGCWPMEAVMLVHIYGRRCDMDTFRLMTWLGDIKGPAMIEDLAEAHGVKPHPATDAACWSFYRNKVVAGEEGGAVWFKDKERAELARSLRSLGFDSRHDFNHRPKGHNYRMSNLHAEAVLGALPQKHCCTLNDYHWGVTNRLYIEACYEQYCPAEWRMPYRDVPWVYDLRIGGLTPVKQDEIIYRLQKVGIAARHGFKPMSMQEEYRRCQVMSKNPESTVGFHSAGTEAAKASREILYLPIAPGVTTESAASRSFEIIRSFLSGLS